MRLTVICLAYLQDSAGVEWLGRYFSRLPAELIVHVDAKVTDAAYRAVAAAQPGVTLARTRFPIWWGGFNTVRSVMEAIRQARETGESDRYLFITEDTVPLLAPAQMLAHLGKDVEFLAINAIPNDPENPFFRRYSDFYFFDTAATNPRIHNPVECALDPELLASFQRVGAAMARGKTRLTRLFHGSGWWGLTNEAVTRILQVHDTDTAFRESFEFSAIPEEQYVHTILAHSNWRRPMQPLIHADFTRPPHPYVFRDQAEIEALQATGPCMLRKVDIKAAGVRSYMQGMLQG